MFLMRACVCVCVCVCVIVIQPSLALQLHELYPARLPLSMGILQARALEWAAISFSRGDLPCPGVKPQSPALQAGSLASEPPGKTFMYCFLS